MPIYEYVCTKCGNTEERLLSVDEGSKDQQCSHCTYYMIKLVSAPAGFKLKGEGFYKPSKD